MSSGLVPRLDFSPLASLGQDLQTGLRQGEVRRAIQGLGVQPGQPGFLPKLGEVMLQSGDISGALGVSRLLEAAGDRAYQRQTDQRDFDFRRTESQRAQTNSDRAFGAQQQGVEFERQRLTKQDALTNYYRDRADTRSDRSLDLQAEAARRREYPAGFQPSPDGNGLQPIPGGPQDPRQIEAQKRAEMAAKGDDTKALPAELGARVALSQSFLEGVPELRKQVQAGGVTGPLDRLQAEWGRGEPGEVLRRIRSGSEAIVRNLTGAGMNESEAKARVAQYEPGPFDNAETVTRKLDMLTEQLQRIEAEAYRGRGVPANRVGKNPYFEAPRGQDAAAQQPSPAPQQPNVQSAPAGRTVGSFDAVPEGARFRRDGRIYRKVNGQAVPE